MAESIKIEIFRKKLPDELTKALSYADSRSDIGSGAAMTAATACAWFLRAAALTAGTKGGGERLDYMLRNGEILRGYMIHLIDEDVKCRGPLRKARKEGDERTIEAAMQPAAAIANEIVNMMHQLLAQTTGSVSSPPRPIWPWARSMPACAMCSSSHLTAATIPISTSSGVKTRSRWKPARHDTTPSWRKPDTDRTGGWIQPPAVLCFRKANSCIYCNAVV